MSGRKGIGVKADDLLDQLEAKAKAEIAGRHRDLEAGELSRLAREIAVAALRFFMVKTGTTRVIAFDFDEALSFEGDSGPYLQYSLVRARNIERKVSSTATTQDSTIEIESVAALGSEVWADDLWDLVHAAASIDETVERAASTLELSLVARTALELAQRFNAAYHHHPVLQETDAALRLARRAAFAAFANAERTLADLLGIPEPERM
jgi:arginyl-tRNA synthetase